MALFPIPKDGFVATYFMVSSDLAATRKFYGDILGGEVLMDGGPLIIKLANIWIIANPGGGPTPDKPTVTLETPPDPDRISSFLNLRVDNIQALYDEWSSRGAQFLTAPIDRGPEIRAYMRDPDGYLIELGQAK